MSRPLSESATRLPTPVTVDPDRIRQYQIRPIPGQLTLFPPNWYIPRADGGAWLAAMRWFANTATAATVTDLTHPELSIR